MPLPPNPAPPPTSTTPNTKGGEDVQPEVRALLEGIWQDPEGMVHQVNGPKGELNLKFRLEV